MDGKTRKELMREEREKLKGMPLKKKLGYVWDYYKAVIGAAAALVFVLFIIAQAVKGAGKTIVFSAALINAEKAGGVEVPELGRDFAEYIKIDEKKEEVSFDDSYLMNPEQGDTITMAAQTKLMAAIQAEMVDVMVMREEVYESYLLSGAFMPLDEALGEEFLEQHQDMLAFGKAEGDTQEKAYGLKFEENEKLQAVCGVGTVYFVVTARAVHLENTGRFVEYLLSGAPNRNL
ncbi:hypothetical protein AALA00_04135 [Lachnospiraceae bacterium 46-15]